MEDFIYKFIIPNDRINKEYPWFKGEYKPSFLKRIQCTIFNEKLKPLEWKNIKQYNDLLLNNKYKFKKPLIGKYKPSECVSQPDMLSVNNQYLRRLIFLIFWIKLYFVIVRYEPLRVFKVTNSLIYSGLSIRFIIFSWFYYTLSKIYFTKDYQIPFN